MLPIIQDIPLKIPQRKTHRDRHHPCLATSLWVVPASVFLAISRQESLLPMFLYLLFHIYHKHAQTVAHAYNFPEYLSLHSGIYLRIIPDQIRIQIKP